MPRPNAPRVDAAQRDAQALELRAAGASYRQIAGRLSISVSTAWACVERGLVRTRREPADQLRTLEAERLDRLQAQAVKALEAQHVVIQGGAVVADSQGNPYVDYGPTLAAVRALLAVQERRARLFGLDAPTKVDARVMTIDQIDARIAELEAQLDTQDLAAGRDPYARKHRKANELVEELAARNDIDARERAEVHTHVIAFWNAWRNDQRALRDVEGFIAEALDVCVRVMALPADQTEQLAASIERYFRGRVG
jgi:hypothetical protein